MEDAEATQSGFQSESDSQSEDEEEDDEPEEEEEEEPEEEFHSEDEDEETCPLREWQDGQAEKSAPKKRKRRSPQKRGKKKSIFGRPDSDSDTEDDEGAQAALAVSAPTVSLGGRVRKQTQHFQPQPVPKPKKSKSRGGGRGRGRGRSRGRATARGGSRGRSRGRGRGGKAKSAKAKRRRKEPVKSIPKTESRWKTHAIGLQELEMLLYSEGLNQDVSTMIREVWLPEGQQKLKQRERQSRRMQSQLKALSFGDAGGLGDPLGVDTASTGRQRRRTAVNYSEAAYDQQINDAIRESNRSYRRRGADPSPPAAAQKRTGVRTTRQGRGIFPLFACSRGCSPT